MKIYVHKTDLRSWQYYPEIPDDRKSEFYEVITDLTNDELISDYEFVLQNGVCTPVRKNKQEQLIADGTKKKADAMVEATLRIAPLQDAVDLDMATDAEKSSLLAWKKYRVLLNRLDITQAPDIDWPEPPDAEKTGD